ncbi:Parkinson disease protein 7-like [Portunus trituberculatus]|uniref:Parkinson disease protein 7-like n=1 Tax=Portunus trituberculatus TaxID=210409 RepID=UPI001E1CD1F0|nr:Parkinson disease protein 7-like [Portunus trituberculatus]
MAEKTALVLLAEGAEEMEAVISIDVLRRGGVKVTVGGIDGSGSVLCSRDVVMLPDMSLEEAVAKGPYDAVVIPGGLKGAENIAQSATVKSLLEEQEKAGRVIGAICAAPAVSLAGIGIGQGKKMTCYPALKDKLTGSGKHTFEDKKVVIDGQFITSQGPGTAFDFGLALVEKLVDSEKRAATAKAMLLQ